MSINATSCTGPGFLNMQLNQTFRSMFSAIPRFEIGVALGYHAKLATPLVSIATNISHLQCTSDYESRLLEKGEV